MSAKAGSIGSIVLGVGLVALGAVAALTPGGQGGVMAIIAGAAMIGGGAYGLTYSPKVNNQGAVRAQDIEIATAGTGFPVPVLFGEQKVTGNFMNWTKANFRAREVRGGGGSSKDDIPESIVGYDYFLGYEYALCMGSIDEVGQVWSIPGEKKMRGNTATDLIFTDGEEYKEIVLDEQDPTNPAGNQSGTIRLYRGSNTQNRIPAGDPYQTGTERNSGLLKIGYTYKISARTDSDFTLVGAASNAVNTVFVATATGSAGILDGGDKVIEYTGLNYRNVCWALFMDFKLGRSPAPRTYQFILRRFPAHDGSFHMKRPDGTTITNFKVRGSNTVGHPCYRQANPAAIIYECLTNTLWGRALPATMFHEASWITASEYFAARNIGMSLVLNQADKLSDIIDGIRAHVKLLPVWDGEVLKLRCLLDPNQTHAAIQTIRKSEVEKASISRPMWPATTNEIRAEFNDASRNFRGNTVHAQDLANIQITGRTNQKRIQLSGFTDFNTARRQAIRILKETSYPAAFGSITMNRFKSQLEVGDVFRFEWDEWGANPVTMYLQVIGMKEASSNEENLEIDVTEDVNLSSIEGTESGNLIPAIQSWELVQDILQSDLSLFVTPSKTNTEITPKTAVELPAIATEGNVASTIITGQRPNAAVTTITAVWKREDESSFRNLATTSNFAITGALLTTFPYKAEIDRTAEAFQFSLTDPTTDEATLLANCVKIQSFTDDMEDLIDSLEDYFIIGEEIIQVGLVQQIGTNIYRARNVVRGCFGSKIEAHPIGRNFFYLRNVLNPLNAAPLGINTGALPMDEIVHFKAYPTSTGGTTQVGSQFTPYHAGLNNSRHLRLGLRPLAPLLISQADDGSNGRSFIIRPRFYDRGAGTGPFFGDFNSTLQKPTGEIVNLISGLDGMTFQYSLVAPSAAGGVSNDGSSALKTIGSQQRVGLVDFLTSEMLYTPDHISDLGAGVVRLSKIPDVLAYQVPFTNQWNFATVTHVRIFAYYKNRLSAESLTVKI